MIERSSDVMYDLYRAQGDEELGFFWFSLKAKVDGFSQFALETGDYSSCG
jgi:hypothetical protein